MNMLTEIGRMLVCELDQTKPLGQVEHFGCFYPGQPQKIKQIQNDPWICPWVVRLNSMRWKPILSEKKMAITYLARQSNFEPENKTNVF